MTRHSCILFFTVLLSGCASRPGFTYSGAENLTEIYGSCGGFTNAYYVDSSKPPVFLVAIRRVEAVTEFSMKKLSGLNDKNVVFPDQINISFGGTIGDIQISKTQTSIDSALYKIPGLPNELEIEAGGIYINDQVIQMKPLHFKYEVRHYLACVQ